MNAHLAKDRKCPVCNGVKKELMYRQTFSEISSVSLLNGYNVVACEECGFCFADNIPTQEDFDLYYGQMSKYESNDKTPKVSKYELAKFKEIFNFLIPYLKDSNLKIVEIGCATGQLLSLLQKGGYKNLLGVDPSKACTETVKQSYQIPVSIDTISTLILEEGTVDLFILVGVLEHIYDLDISLQKLWRYLSKNGMIYIAVPDASQYFMGTDAPFQEFSLEHINYFGPTSLTNILEINGFLHLNTAQSLIEFNQGTFTPLLQSIFTKNSADDQLNFKNKDIETPQNLGKYIDKSKSEDLLLRNKIKIIVESKQPIIIWGTGAQLLRLMETTNLREALISAFVDSNPKYIGERLNGVEIISPENIIGSNEAILITSRVFQFEIKNQIRTELKMDNEIIEIF